MADKRQTKQRSFQHHAAAQAQIVTLQKEDDLESFAIKRGEPEQNQSPPKAGMRDSISICTFEQRFAPAIMRADPAAPINLVKEPVHDHEQNDDGEKSGRGLQIERRHVVAERINNAHCDEPGDQGGDECDARADRNRTPMRLFRAGHARGDRGQNENALQSLAKNQNPDVEKRNRRTRIRLHRVRCAVRRHSLPNDHSDNEKRGYDNADAKSRLHLIP